MPDRVVGDKSTIKLGETTLELIYVGRNHSDNSLVMRLPKEKIVFTVDFAPIEGIQFRNMPDNASPIEYVNSLKKLAALDWERMIPGHPYAGGRFGTKKDIQDHIAYLEDLSAETKKAADGGKCFDTAMKEVKVPKYEKWTNYEQVFPPTSSATATGGAAATELPYRTSRPGAVWLPVSFAMRRHLFTLITLNIAIRSPL